MARVSRKAAIMETEPKAAFLPERVYNTAVYARLSVEDNNRTGDRESITMQRYMLENMWIHRRICGFAACSATMGRQARILSGRNLSA